MRIYRAWYLNKRDQPPSDVRYPHWVVRAEDEASAKASVLSRLHRADPERGYVIFLSPIENEDEATIAYASARQSGQAID